MADAKQVILGAICARGGSKGVPRKHLRPLAGRPLIAHTIACARACRALTHVVVSTDDEVIAAAARQYGADVPFIRPAYLARDDSSKWDVFRHLVETWEQMTGRRVSVLADLDIGVPLRLPIDVTNCLERLAATDADVVVTAYEAERNPYFNMVELEAGGLARIVKTPATPIAARQMAPVVFSLSPAVYAIRRDALWAYEHWSQARVRVHAIPRERAVDIDTESDFRFVEFLSRTLELNLV
jgi:N-acylneuraminate cytidylyltransferase/CMP-N,N'-diacetyllegionaminic acid synthase